MCCLCRPVALDFFAETEGGGGGGGGGGKQAD